MARPFATSPAQRQQGAEHAQSREKWRRAAVLAVCAAFTLNERYPQTSRTALVASSTIPPGSSEGVGSGVPKT